MFVPPTEMVVMESDYWRINQRVDARLPGYLMVAPKDSSVTKFSQLGAEASIEMGVLLQKTARALEDLLHPTHLYVGRYGPSAGHSLHFHVIPVYDWVAEAFRDDPRYRRLREFDTPGVLNSGQLSGFDGAEMTLFIWREYAEGSRTLPPQCPEMATVLALLRKALGG